MAKLVLKFENSVLKEMPVGSKEVSIGRSPENGLVIDNPAVSHYHARVFNEEGRLMLEDFGSMNGTFVNGQRVKMVTLKPGDSVGIGKHTIVVSESREMDGFASGNGSAKPAAPKINETVMLDTKERREFLQKVAAVGESSQVAPSRLKVPTLIVRKGRTNQKEYALNDKLTVVGKSGMATVKLKGWFAPKAAAQITRRDDHSYYIGAADKVPSVNGQPVLHPTILSSGDIIVVAGIEMEFVYRD
ncbi:MAG TPA: FHA domain-containing protein [Candidatus Acidoferrales bacterium]|jgi:pSer/pThr/pTyr-binding forkhead associated (FHA) protein|nr:FHA domain-containing protein [Candidatus Acidoferrales bacterium]